MTLERDALRRRLQQWAHAQQWYGWEKGRLGIIQDGQQVVEAAGRPGWVNVRVDRGSELVPTVAINTSVKSVYDLPVWVGTNQQGQRVVKGIDDGLVATLGRSAQALAVPDVVTVGIINERRFEPGLVQAKRNAGVYTMSVYINSFVYTAPDGTRHEYPGGWLNLASYIPETENTRRWVLVGVNMVTNTAAALAGDAVGLATTLDMALLNEIDPGDVKPLAGVNLSYGMTAVDSDNLILDARAFLDGGAVSSGATIPGAGAWNPDLTPATPDADDDEFSSASLDGDWTEENRSGAITVSVADDQLTLACTSWYNQFTIGPAGVYRTPPAGSFQLVTKVSPRIAPDVVDGGDWVSIYLFLAFSDDSLVGLNFTHSSAQTRFSLGARTPDTDSYYRESSAASFVISSSDEWAYLRMRYDASNDEVAGDFSLDGINWTSFSLSTADIAGTPAAVWLSISSDGPAEGIFEFYRVRDGYGTQTDPVYGRNEDVTASYVPVYSDDVSNPPTDAELDAAIGTPATVGAGYVALLDDNGAGAAMYLIASDGTNWWHAALTKAT